MAKPSKTPSGKPVKATLAGLASALLIAIAVGGGLLALLRWGRLDAFGSLAWRDLWRVPDDGALLLGALTVIGWVAWAMVTATVLAEAINMVSKGRLHLRLPGAGWLRPAVAAMVIAIAGIAVSVGGNVKPAVSQAVLAPADADAALTSQPSQVVAGEEQAGLRPYVVRPGDDLWSLAERFSGGGPNWRMIAQANSSVVLDPSVELAPGALLMVPDNQPAQAAPKPGQDGQATVTVKRGDTLWGLAGTYLGDPLRWPEIFAANRGIINNPRLIHPGQVLVLPGVNQAEDKPPKAVELPPLAGTLTEISRPPASPPPDGAAGAGSSVPTAGQDQSETGPGPIETSDGVDSMLVALIGSIGAGLAGALLASIAMHRLLSMRDRPVGRALPPVGEVAARVETALGKRANWLVGQDIQVEPAVVDAVTLSTPKRGASGQPDWPLDDVAALRPALTMPLEHQPGASPVALGVGADGNDVLVNLSGAGLVVVDGTPDQSHGVMAAMLGQLMAMPAEQRPEVMVADGQLGWIARLLDCPVAPPDQVWRMLHRRLVHDVGLPVGEPLVVFADGSAVESPGVVTCLPDVTVVATAAGLARDNADLLIEVSLGDQARLPSTGQVFTAQLMPAPARRALAEIVEAMASRQYPKAPWWNDEAPENHESDETHDKEAVMVDQLNPPLAGPRLMVLGPVTLVGATGAPPDRSARACQETCGWLLRHPGQTAPAMAAAMMVAEGTRRSNVSRLRLWLGCDEANQAYLPEAYSGQLQLHQGVTSDWEALQLLVVGGVNQASDQSLVQALQLVRGAPLADAAPGQWNWAEAWRTEMMCQIRDIGVVLGKRALARGDSELARWAINRAMLACPSDEQLMASLLQTEQLAGNRAEVERIAMHITRTARLMGADLSAPMVAMLQQAIEGAPRLRLASESSYAA